VKRLGGQVTILLCSISPPPPPSCIVPVLLPSFGASPFRPRFFPLSHQVAGFVMDRATSLPATSPHTFTPKVDGFVPSATSPSRFTGPGGGLRHRPQPLSRQPDGHNRRLLPSARPRVQGHEVQANVQPVHRAVHGVPLLPRGAGQVGRGRQLGCLPARDATTDGLRRGCAGRMPIPAHANSRPCQSLLMPMPPPTPIFLVSRPSPQRPSSSSHAHLPDAHPPPSPLTPLSAARPFPHPFSPPAQMPACARIVPIRGRTALRVARPV
jgi:hypothetical protein